MKITARPCSPHAFLQPEQKRPKSPKRAFVLSAKWTPCLQTGPAVPVGPLRHHPLSCADEFGSIMTRLFCRNGRYHLTFDFSESRIKLLESFAKPESQTRCLRSSKFEAVGCQETIVTLKFDSQLQIIIWIIVLCSHCIAWITMCGT